MHWIQLSKHNTWTICSSKDTESGSSSQREGQSELSLRRVTFVAKSHAREAPAAWLEPFCCSAKPQLQVFQRIILVLNITLIHLITSTTPFAVSPNRHPLRADSASAHFRQTSSYHDPQHAASTSIKEGSFVPTLAPSSSAGHQRREPSSSLAGTIPPFAPIIS